MPEQTNENTFTKEDLWYFALDAQHQALHELNRAFRNAKERGVTQEDIAHKLDISPSLVSRRLNGRSNLTLKTLSDMFRALDERLCVTGEPLADLPQSNYCFEEFRALAGHRLGRLTANGQTVGSRPTLGRLRE